ncbi:hypothetical protein LOZ58_003942 [Ophidiomyces ophidiicola]|nr:hypothetical protein LOZ58_003942 [Ophidiomyces ophidiicola]
MKFFTKCAFASAVVLYLACLGVTTPVTTRAVDTIPSHVSIECFSGQCSEKDLKVLADVLDKIQNDPKASKNWNVTSSIETVKLGVKKHVNGIKLAPRDDAPETKSDLAGLDLNQVKHCAAGDCSKQDLEAIKNQVNVATIPSWLWPILGSIGKFKFNYGLDYGMDSPQKPPAPKKPE